MLVFVSFFKRFRPKRYSCTNMIMIKVIMIIDNDDDDDIDDDNDDIDDNNNNNDNDDDNNNDNNNDSYLRGSKCYNASTQVTLPLSAQLMGYYREATAMDVIGVSFCFFFLKHFGSDVPV